MDGYVKTAETPAGQPADALIEQVPTSALLADALDQYNASNWEAALQRQVAASKRPDGQQLRRQWHLPHQRAPPPAARRRRGVRADRRPRLGDQQPRGEAALPSRDATDFFPTPIFAGMYPMWIRQIARAAQATKSC